MIKPLWKWFVKWYRLGYWGRMTEEKAKATSAAIFYEFGAVEAGKFNELWVAEKIRRNGLGA